MAPDLLQYGYEPIEERLSDDFRYSLARELEAVTSDAMRAALIADAILSEFHAYHSRYRAVPELAKTAFESCEWAASVRLSRERLTLYSRHADRVVQVIEGPVHARHRTEELWRDVTARYVTVIKGAYYADLAYAFLNTIRRKVLKDRWRRSDYSYMRVAGVSRPPVEQRTQIYCVIAFEGALDPATIEAVLEVPGLRAPFHDKAGDCARAAARINERLGLEPVAGEPPGTHAFEIVDGGFYRNRGAYIVGRLKIAGRREPNPFALALLNGRDGIFIDAVLLRQDTLQFVFSSTLANFHVTIASYHELVDFLHEMMPARPHGLHYSTVGYNHLGKNAVMREIERDLERSGEPLDHAVGPRGTVAIGFTTPSSRYILKVIRNHPTDQYKWGAFAGVASVLDKYRQVHELNRSGSMLDNVMFEDLVLPAEVFAADLEETLLRDASDNVRRCEEGLLFHHLIVQMKMIPLPVYLSTASPEDARAAITNLGHCIKNNAAANVFNKDLDGRNYGVGPTGKVYLFDYDAVEPLSAVKVRTNTDRIDGDEDVPDWFFEDGIVFLPEEIELHLRIDDPALRRHFRDHHGEILTVDYWTTMQRLLAEGRVPRVMTYPEDCLLEAPREGA